jgi:hypothetical protein
LTNGIASNQKASARQRKQLPAFKQNLQKGRISLPLLSNKGLKSRIHKKLKKLNTKNQRIQLINGQMN